MSMIYYTYFSIDFLTRKARQSKWEISVPKPRPCKRMSGVKGSYCLDAIAPMRSVKN